MKRYIVEKTKTGGKWDPSEEPNILFTAGPFETVDEASEWTRKDIEESRVRWPLLGNSMLMLEHEGYICIGHRDFSIDYLIVRLGLWEILVNRIRGWFNHGH